MPDTHITKNYFAHGGNELIIGGKLVFLEGAEVENFPGTASGSGFTPAASVPDSEATTVAGLKESFNDLLAALRTAGLMATNAADTNDDETNDADPAENPTGTEEGGGA